MPGRKAAPFGIRLTIVPAGGAPAEPSTTLPSMRTAGTRSRRKSTLERSSPARSTIGAV